MLSEFVIESIFTVFLTGNNQIGGKDGLGVKTTMKNLKNQTIYNKTPSKETHALIASYEKTSSFCQDHEEGKIHAAIRMGDADVLPILAKMHDLQQRNKEGRTPLHIATTQRNLPVLRRLLELEIAPDLDVQDNQGKTPLFIAATEAKDLQLIQFLLDLGANPKVQTKDGLSLLDAVKQINKTQQTAAIFKLLTTL